MNNLLSTSGTLRALETFRGTVREFAAREEALNREHRNLAEAEEKRFQQRKRAAETALTEHLQAAKAELDGRLEHVQSRFVARERRLHEAHGAARKKALEGVDLEEGRRKYAVQKGTLEARRRHDEMLAANDSQLERFQARLNEARADLEATAAASKNAFRGMALFQRFLRREALSEDLNGSHEELLDEAVRLQALAKENLAKFQQLAAPKIFRMAPIWVWIVIAVGLAAGLSPVLQRFAYPLTAQQGYAFAGAVLALALFLYFAAYQSGASLAGGIATALLRAAKLQQVAEERAQSFHAEQIARIEQETNDQVRAFETEWESAVKEAAAARQSWPEHLRSKWERARVANEDTRATLTEKVKAAGTERINTVVSEGEIRKAEVLRDHDLELSNLKNKHAAAWDELAHEWDAKVHPLLKEFQMAGEWVGEKFPHWSELVPENWNPPREFSTSVPFARLEVDLAKYSGAVPHDVKLALPQTSTALPLLLQFPREGSLLFETSGAGKEAVMGVLNNLVFRLLAGTPAGKLSFTIFDPVSLGQNFAAVTHLADYEENLIDGRIWTQPDQIEQRLADLNEHMEKVIQMYLRNEYESIVDYNAAAGNITERFHFLIIADFPANFTDAAMKRLLRIATSGARCGVFTWIHWDHRQPAPPEHLADELRKASIVIQHTGNQFVLAEAAANPGRVLLDEPPAAELGNRFLERVGETSRGASRVEVPFAQVSPELNETWSLDTATELRVPIGRSGASKLQYLALGRGTSQHALIAGKTGSGKSTLFHVMITNLALWASPEQVEFYLVDFKKGVEFKSYATHRLPHARVIAIESDREFGLSVLQRVDEELRRRGELFRQLGVQDIGSYRATSRQSMPRTLLLIDEFQEFFVEEDRVAQSAAMLLDRIVRQGRAFGIHVILGSQTLGGAYTLARATLGQMAVRIALQSNETDAYLIMDENNAAPRLLSRPGEGIYNDMAGAVEGNSPFQVVWLSEAERAAALTRVQQLARGKNYPAPVVFEGNAPADVRDNGSLTELLVSPRATATESPVIWLGAPNAIKGPTEVVFHRRSGSHLLIVGQREEAILTLIGVGMLTLAAQFPPDQARFILFESTAPGTTERAFLDSIVQAMPHPVARGNPEGDLAAALDTPGRTFIFIHNLQNFKRLRTEDEFSFGSDSESVAAKFNRIISEGAAQGVHVIASLDTYNNVTRFLSRKGLAEFGLRVLFQMSPNDSSSLIDDSKASHLGLYRALLYNEQEGRTETFRPYARPDEKWFQGMRR